MNTVLKEHVFPTGQTLQMIQGDITSETVSAIVNAANEHLQHGGGVAWAISSKGGATVQSESDAWLQQHGPVAHSHPAWTSGGRLPAKYIIHAVGPIWHGGRDREDEKLEQALTGSLRVADELKCASIALPAISTGIFGFPKERAVRILFSALENYFSENPASGLQVVRFVLYDEPTVDAFTKIWSEKWDHQ